MAVEMVAVVSVVSVVGVVGVGTAVLFDAVDEMTIPVQL